MISHDVDFGCTGQRSEIPQVPSAWWWACLHSGGPLVTFQRHVGHCCIVKRWDPWRPRVNLLKKKHCATQVPICLHCSLGWKTDGDIRRRLDFDSTWLDVKTVSLYIIILCGIGDLTHANPSVLFHFFGDSSIIPVVIGNRNGFRLVSFSIRKYRFIGRLLSTPSGTRCNRLFRKR